MEHNDLKRQSGERLRYLDMAKGLGILMITYGHITEIGNPVDDWMSLFKITIFFITAGYLMAMKRPQEKNTVPGYTIKLGKSLIWPYMTFSVIFIIMTLFRGFVKQTSYMHTLKLYAYATVTLRGISTLWFLPCLFFAQILFFIIIKNRHKILMAATLVWPILVGLVSERWLGTLEETLTEFQYTLVSYPVIMVSKALISVWFVLLGYMGYFAVNKFLDSDNKRLIAGIVLTVATLVLSLVTSGIDFNMMHLGDNPVCFFLGGIIGSFGAILLFQGLERWWSSDLLVYFGVNSLILMTIQRSLFIIRIAEKGWGQHFKLHDFICQRYYLETLCILVIVLVMAAGIIELINRKCPWIMKLK